MRFISYSLSSSTHLSEHTKFSTTQISNVAMLKVYILKKVWSPIVWKFGERHTDNFDFSDYCGLDFDNTISIHEAIGIFKDYRAVIATTENHQKIKKGEIGDRFRVVMPWERRITSCAEYVHNMTAIIKEYSADSSCKDAGRLFKPSKKIVFANDMDLYPVEPYTPPPPRPVKVYTGTPGWLQEMIGRGSDGEEGRNIAGFKIAAAAFRCGADDDEVMEMLNRSYGVETLSFKEKKHVIKSAKKCASKPCRVVDAHQGVDHE